MAYRRARVDVFDGCVCFRLEVFDVSISRSCRYISTWKRKVGLAFVPAWVS